MSGPPPAVLPAVLRGARVDFWPAALWARLMPGRLPAGGWWLDRRAGNAPLAALDGDQSLLAAESSGRIRIRLDCARRAEAGLPAAWTGRLTPLPPPRAREILAGRQCPERI